MQLTITRDKYQGHAKSPWLVVLPRRISPTGRRQYKRFATRGQALNFVAAVRGQVRREGEQPLAAVPAALAADARAAVKLLEGTGLSLSEAVARLLGSIGAQGVALGQHLHHGGAGEAEGVYGGGTAPGLTLGGILRMVEAAKNEHQSAATVRTRRGVCGTLFTRNPGLEDTPLLACTPALIQDALDRAWPAAPASWNCARRVLHALFGYATKRRLVSMPNPLAVLDLKRIHEQEITALPPEGLRALFLATREAPELRAYLAICAFAGIRPTECTRLTWGDVDLEEGVISVRAQKSKTGGTRHVEVPPVLRAWLEYARPEGALATDYITPRHNLIRRLGALRARAGYGHGTWQNDCLRHSYATYYLKAKLGTLDQLRLNMGHRDAQLLYSRYTNMRGVTRASAEEWWRVSPDIVLEAVQVASFS